MSKAEEFAALAKAATPGVWEALACTKEIPPRVRAIWLDEEGRRCMRFIAACESGNHDEDAQFIAWCANNRELIEEALNWLEHMERTV